MNEPTHATQLNADHPTVARLIELQERLGESDNRFASRWLRLAASTWGRIKKGDYYQHGDHSKIAEKLDGCLAALEDHMESAAGKVGRELVSFSSTATVIAGIKEAMPEERNRLVVFRAPTGGGKTKLAELIAANYPGRVTRIEATEAWRENYLTAILRIAAAIGLRDVPPRVREAEDALVAALRDRPHILVIDEAHYLGKTTINLAKLILNSSKCVVVFLAIPVLWDKIVAGAWHEAEQLRTRSTANLLSLSLSHEDVARFLASRLGAAWASLNGSSKEAVALVKAASERFGMWDTAERIADAVRLEIGSRGTLTTDHFRSAIAQVEALR